MKDKIVERYCYLDENLARFSYQRKLELKWKLSPLEFIDGYWTINVISR